MTFDPTVGVPEHSCTRCHKRMNAMTDAEGSDVRPEDGDLAVCLYCSHPMRLEKGRVRSLTAAEFVLLSKVEQAGLVSAMKAAQLSATWKRPS